MHTKYGCRKFILASFVTVVSSCALFAGIVDGREFCGIVGVVFGTYVGGDVVHKKNQSNNGV